MSFARRGVMQFVVERPLLLGMIVLSLLTHLAAGLAFQVKFNITPQERPIQPRVVFVGEPEEAELGLAAVRDPSLSALASSHGFSASVFTPPATFAFEAPAVAAASRPLRERPVLGAAVPAPSASSIEDSPAAKLRPASKEQVSDSPSGTSTRVLIAPPLAARMPSAASKPPRLVGAAPAQAVMLRVGVDVFGTVRYALVEESSGSATADRIAVKLVQSWHFASKPDTSDDLVEWGDVKIFWAGAGEAKPAALPSGEGTR